MDFLDKLKQGLDKGVATVSVKSREILDANRVKSQTADLERQKKDALTALGTSVCAMLDGGHLDDETLRIARLAISAFDQQIVEKQQELARIHTEAQQALEGATPPNETPVAAHCTSCGAALTPAAKFCGGCGRQI
jgi:hypothetical protein